MVKKWVFGHLCHFRGVTFFGVPQKVTYFVGSLFGPTFGPPFVTFLINHRRGPYKYSKRYPKWSKRWSKTGHLRVPKTPILTKNGDFWTKTPRGSPGSGPPQKPLFWGFLEIGQKAVIFTSGFWPSEKGPKKGSFLGVSRGVKNGDFGKNRENRPKSRHFHVWDFAFFGFYLFFFVVFWSFLSIFGPPWILGCRHFWVFDHFLDQLLDPFLSLF